MIWILLIEFPWHSLTCSSNLCIPCKLVGISRDSSFIINNNEITKILIQQIYILNIYYMPESVQFSPSVMSGSATPWTAACQASLSITNSQSLFKLMSNESVMPSNHLILCRPLLLPPSIFPYIRVFSNESVLQIRWPKYWSFSFSISPSKEHSRLISFGLDWLDRFAVQGTQESSPIPQFKSINSSALSFLYTPTLTS